MRKPRVLVLRTCGTNCDLETEVALEEVGAEVEVLNFKKLALDPELLWSYEGLVIPGGFSYGDFVRAGAIWAKKLLIEVGKELKEFIREGRGVLGICNGFQVLVEMGVLPGIRNPWGAPEASLAVNDSMRYECRWTYLLVQEHKCKALSELRRGMLLRVPVAHKEGKFVLPKEREEDLLGEMKRRGQIVMTYAKPDGSPAEGEYPFNPNGSLADIASICNPEGNVVGMMPHPERATFGWQLPDWSKSSPLKTYGDGYLIFSSFIDYLKGLI